MNVMKINNDVTIDGVFLEKGHQLSIEHVTESMLEAEARGDVTIKSADETLEERKADVEAWKMDLS